LFFGKCRDPQTGKEGSANGECQEENLRCPLADGDEGGDDVDRVNGYACLKRSPPDIGAGMARRSGKRKLTDSEETGDDPYSSVCTQ